MLSALTPMVPKRDSIEIEMGNEFLNGGTRCSCSCLYCKFSIRSGFLSRHSHWALDSQSLRQDGPFRLYKALSWLWFKLLWLAPLLDNTQRQQVIEIGLWNQEHASFWSFVPLWCFNACIFFPDQVWKLFFSPENHSWTWWLQWSEAHFHQIVVLSAASEKHDWVKL